MIMWRIHSRRLRRRQKQVSKILVPSDPIAEAMRNRGTDSSKRPPRMGDSAEMSIGAFRAAYAGFGGTAFKLQNSKAIRWGVDFWPYFAARTRGR